MGTGEQPPNPSLTWLTNEPVWVDQWPMTKERLQIAKQLVAEQLAAGHIKPSVSPWNTPIFVIPKKSGKWRLLHDLRKVNDQMQSMGALQPGMPSLNTQRFAFSVPTVNKAAPAERYEWVVLPQGMKNSPTLCQLYVAWALQPLRAQWSNTIIYHYMDDILCCREQPFSDESLRQLITILAKKGLVIAPEKVQHTAPWKYLGWSITDSKIRPQKTELVTQLHTLHDIQTLLGDIQWVRNCVGISNTDIAPLTALLRGTNPADKVTLTMEHHTVLQQIIQKMHAAWSSRRILPLPISLIVCNGKDSPYAVICQWQNKKGEFTSTLQLNATATAKCKGQGDMFNILEWVFLSVQPKRSIQTRTEAVGELIRKGRSRIIEISGQEPEDISIPVSTVEVEWWLRNAEAIQNALLGYGGKIHSQQPQGKLWQMLRRNQWIQRSKVSNNPLPDGVTVYTDAGKRLRRAACVWKEGDNWKQYVMEGQPQDSLQTLELTAVIWALTNWINIPLNVVTDSMYVAGIVPRLEDALLRETTNPRLGSLFIRLRSVLGQRTAACCIIHIRSHQLDLGLGQGHGPVWVPSRNVKPVLTPHGSSDKQDEPTPDHRDSTPGEPFRTCLLGVPGFKATDFSSFATKNCSRATNVSGCSATLINSLNVTLPWDPQELSLLGSMRIGNKTKNWTQTCFIFGGPAFTGTNYYRTSNWIEWTNVTSKERRYNDYYDPAGYCGDQAALGAETKGGVPIWNNGTPKALPPDVFLICGDRAWQGVPQNVFGGPCYLGKLTLLAPDQNWWKDVRNKTIEIKHRTKREITGLSPDCDDELALLSTTERVFLSLFIPGGAAGRALKQVGQLACWAKKQAKVTTQVIETL
ncbi:hypothetical protein QYF61_019762 [Mycteria americana]|uniref:ribonuclease H n=1 Tax=Mycteria americana TaxID=33587 RepID=A0AAN7NGR8_MYCAM|nr:hypothetical protein QYF61_019762 [Mycteria americana]